MEIIPAIIGENFEEVKDKIQKVHEFSKWVQIDVCDGVFVTSKSWPYNAGDKVSDLLKVDFLRKDETKIEVHLMIENPEDVIDEWVEYGADRILVHYESTNKLSEILNRINSNEVESGIALKLETPIEALEEFVPNLDVIQFMSISEIGFYGHGFEESVLQKIKSLRAKYPGVKINVDGGVNLDNAKELIEAGADNLIVGSGIFKEKNIEEAVNNFKKVF